MTPELDRFSYHLEENLYTLFSDLQHGGYRHGGYRTFMVHDNKKRKISVASIRDRVVHRLVYEYLVSLYDKTFLFDVWSCRKEKGLLGAILRAQKFLASYPKGFVWRADISKFFDNVDREVLLSILQRKISDIGTILLLKEIIESGIERERERVKEFREKAFPSAILQAIFLRIFISMNLISLRYIC